MIELIVDDTIYITKSKYEYTFLSVLTTLGGHIGVCRTVVWVGLSIFGAKNYFHFAGAP